MRCSEFLSGFSDYRDDRMTAGDTARFAAHRSECSSCRRYESVLNAGLDVLRSSAVDVREDFGSRLQHSIYALDEEARRRAIPRGTGAIPILAMAAIAVSVLIVPVAWPADPVAELPPIVANAPSAPSNPIALPVTAFETEVSPTLGISPLWAESNTLLYEYSSLNARYREPTLVRTNLR